MYDLLYELTPYAPLVILIAAFLDVFFITGYLLYGFAMAGSVAMMYSSGMISAEVLITSAFIGTYTGNLTNFAIGHFFSECAFIRKHLKLKQIDKTRQLLKEQRLFVFMAICRSITFIRPAYSLLLGTLGIKKRKFIFYEAIIAFCWVTFWVLVIIFGESFISNYLSK